MKKYKAVIFDLDGVICHTDKYHYQAWKAVADELGIYFDEEINNRLRGEAALSQVIWHWGDRKSTRLNSSHT